MKVLLLLTGLMLGLLAGAALGVAAGLAWIAVFDTTGFEGDSGMLVFLTFMPIRTLIGGLIGAVGLGMLALRDAGPAISRGPSRPACFLMNAPELSGLAYHDICAMQ